jgi:hypothetical protein
MSFVPPKPVFLTASAIERITDEHLQAAGLMPTADNPVVDIEALIEGHFGARLDQHADLEPGVLGVTTFEPGKAPLVEINRDLSEAADQGIESWVRGRWRITLAHEASHIIFHRKDYEGSTQASLFGEPPAVDAPRLQRCLKRDLHELSRRVDPREYQANLGMAAILMPKAIFTELALPLLLALPVPWQSESFRMDPRYLKVISELALRFQVSKEAARIRVEKLGLDAAIGQQQMRI